LPGLFVIRTFDDVLTFWNFCIARVAKSYRSIRPNRFSPLIVKHLTHA